MCSVVRAPENIDDRGWSTAAVADWLVDQALSRIPSKSPDEPCLGSEDKLTGSDQGKQAAGRSSCYEN